MFDKELAIEIIQQISSAIQTIIERFKPVKSVDDFLDSPAGIEKLDSICMQLLVIGESLKNLDKVTDNSLLPNYPQIDWKKVKGLRDIISHHYIDINAEAIFDVCDNKLKPLLEMIDLMLKDLKD